MTANKDIITEWIPAAYRQIPDQAEQQKITALPGSNKFEKKQHKSLKRKNNSGK